MGERLLDVKNNPISLAMTLGNFAIADDDDKAFKSVSEIGSMLFTRGVSGTRAATGKEEKVFQGNHVFKGWGSHYDNTDVPYITAAAAIGMTHNDINLFIKRLDKVLAQKTKSYQPNGKKLQNIL